MPRKQNWRLSKTLSRNVESRPIEDSDMKYLWAAYRQGALGEMFEDADMDAATFRESFEEAVLTGYNGAWTISADTKKGFLPIGIVLGTWHPLVEVMVVAGIAWFPWASTRNITEGTVSFFNQIRNEIPMMGYAKPEHKRMYEIVMKHGIMRRIGTSHSLFTGSPTAIFETRAA